MKDGAIVCNTGHYDCEINLGDLGGLAEGEREIRANCEEYTLTDGRRIYVLAQGRLVNLAAAEGHPSRGHGHVASPTSSSSLVRLAREGRRWPSRGLRHPGEQDQEIAALKLATMGLELDKLTNEQIAYADDYLAGT